MKIRLWRDLIILLLIFGGLWFAFSKVAWKTNLADLKLSKEHEEKLAELVVNNILNNYDIENDSLIVTSVNIVSERLLNALDNNFNQYKIHVLKQDQVNAFATLGNNIFIFTGLLQFTENPYELAAVLAHEMGHIEKGHITDKLISELGISVIIAILTNGDPGMITEVSQLLVSSGFSRKYEREADDFAQQHLVKANINPNRIAVFFTRLKRNNKTSKHLEIMMTHPDHTSRIEDALNFPIPDDFEEQEFEVDWHKMKKRL